MTRRTLHLAIEAALWHTEGRWRFPNTFDRQDYFTAPGKWVEMARYAERGCVDLLFWGEGYGIPSTYGGNTDAAVRWGVQWPRHDMSTIIPILAWETERIGFVQTVSTTFSHPFHVARFSASMDHVTGGRFGVNLINSARMSDFANFGYEELPAHAERYERMQEFVEVCTALWSSVEPEALVLDRETGVFGDPDRVHPVDHRGRFFSSAGPLPVLASPQGRPLLVQAGGSAAGNAFAARNVDVQYASAGDDAEAWRGMRAQRSRLDRELELLGRPPGSVKLIFDVSPIVGETDDDAHGLLRAMRAAVAPEAALAYLSHNCTFDFAELPVRFTLGEVIERSEAGGGSRNGPLHAFAARFGPDEPVAREHLVEAVREAIVPGGIVGAGGRVADRLEDLHERGGGDGFAVHLRPSIETSVKRFVDDVIPILQERGVFRRDYDDSATLRERISR